MNTREEISRRTFLQKTMRVGAAGLLASQTVAAAAMEAKNEPKSRGWEIGCYTRPWSQHDYRVALDAIAEAGFKYAGLMTTKSKTRLVISATTTPEEAVRIGEEVRKRGLKISSVYGGGIPVGKSLKAGIAVLRKLVDRCAAAKAETLLMGGMGDPKLNDVYYQAIIECVEYAAKKRVGITLKPHGGLNATGPQCRRAVEKVGHKNFRLWYDPGNIYYYSNGKLDPVKDAATVDGVVTGMCVKDYKHPKKVDVTPGDGQVDFPAVFACLKKGGFSHGSLVIETITPGDLAALLKEAKKARAFVEKLVTR